jgi:hypothetical protein
MWRILMYDYWVVTERSTGRVIAHCGEESDARMMYEFDTNNRSYRKQKFIMDQVIDITSTYDKQLPGQIGLPEGEVNQLQEFKVKLPEGQGQPVNIR